MLAVQLLRQSCSLSIGIVDRGSAPGRGLAYCSPHRFHLLNVPAGEMSAFPMFLMIFFDGHELTSMLG
jgi:uncharacterized NAD(P)/FAD-binding protein YdhS